jgi:hypothetical protein
MEMVVRSMEMAETAMETDGDGFGGTSPSWQGAKTETYVPQNSLEAAAELPNCSRNFTDSFRVYVGRLFIGEGASSGGDQGGLTTGGATRGWPRPLMVRLAPGPPSALVRSSTLFQET